MHLAYRSLLEYCMCLLSLCYVQMLRLSTNPLHVDLKMPLSFALFFLFHPLATDGVLYIFAVHTSELEHIECRRKFRKVYAIPVFTSLVALLQACLGRAIRA